MYPVYYWPFSSASSPTPPPPTAPKVGWFAEWDKKRTIPVELLREILKAQGSPWADELAETVKAVEQKPPKTKKHQRVIEQVVRRVVEYAPVPMDWGPALQFLQAANAEAQAAIAAKHAEDALRALKAAREAAEREDEEAIMAWILSRD